MAEQWLVHAALAEARMFRRDLISSGCEETVARRFSVFVCCLLEDSSKLRTRADTDEDDVLKLTVGLATHMPILHYDDRLLPYWNRFTEALSSAIFSKSARINLSLIQVQLSNEVMEMLLQSLKNAPVAGLYFYNNILSNDAYYSLVKLFNTSTSLKTLCIERNPIQSEDVATKLVNAVIDHPNVDDVMLECEIGQSNEIMKAVLPLLCLKEVYLDGNHIGSYGVELISDCLATNPTVQRLFIFTE